MEPDLTGTGTVWSGESERRRQEANLSQQSRLQRVARYVMKASANSD